MTITPRGRGRGVVQHLADVVSMVTFGRFDRRLTRPSWLRPHGGNLGEMMRILGRARLRGWAYVMFMLHSSELMPGGSPRFRTSSSIEAMYDDMDALFERAARRFTPMTLSEFHDSLASDVSPEGRRAVALGAP
jgi:hypothetical protein